jgi:hypothetical protein
MNKRSIFSGINKTEPANIETEALSQERSNNRLVQEIESRLDLLVESLQRGEFPVNLKKISHVFDGLVAIDRLPLDVPAHKFIDLYNDLPNILNGYAIDATLSDESYREQSPSQITYYRLDRGTYWVFPTDIIGQHGTAWLVPNPFKEIRIDRHKTLNYGFDLDTSSQSSNSIIILVKPAIVKILPHAERLTWKLIERGEIRTGGIDRSQSHESKEISSLKTELGNIKVEYQQLKRQQESRERELINRFQQLIAEEVAKIQLSSQPPQTHALSLVIDRRDDISGSNGLSTSSEIETIEAEIIPSVEENYLLSTSTVELAARNHDLTPFARLYNAGKDKFLRSYMVSTASLMRTDDSTLKIVEDNTGDYWIVPFNNHTHYLVPKIEFPNYSNSKCLEILSPLFDETNDTKDFRLFKPAIVTVTKSTMPKQWKLEQKGYLIAK